MSKLSELQGKGILVKIGEIELELKPLTLKELHLFSMNETAPMEQQLENTTKLITTVLKKSVPDATDDEINNISLEYSKDLMDAITKLHKLDEGDSQRIKDVIAARQAQVKNKQ